MLPNVGITMSIYIGINHCLSSPCSKICVNTLDGFLCDCPPNLRLQADGHTCKGQLLCMLTEYHSWHSYPGVHRFIIL